MDLLTGTYVVLNRGCDLSLQVVMVVVVVVVVVVALRGDELGT